MQAQAHSNRIIKRRASKACCCCRARKVRCDVVGTGIPCTNCRLDEVECLVTGQRKRRVINNGTSANPAPVELGQEKSPPQFTIFDDIDGLQDITPPPDPALLNSNISVPGQNYARPRTTGLYAADPSQSSQTGHTGDTDYYSLSPENVEGHFPTSSSAHTASAVPSYPPIRSQIILPNFIQPIPTRISPTDLEYLQKKGAFVIPETNLRNQLLRCYVQFVHPYLPLLDLQHLLATVEGNNPTQTVSLLLFQAAMFAATPYVDLRHLSTSGYSSRRGARRTFFHRVKILYDLDYELDHVTIIQSALLMTYWFERSDDPKDASHWLSIAISLSCALGIDRDPNNDTSLDLRQQHLWKRTWWSCIMRDRLIALALRRPVRIHLKEFTLPMLDSSDFETEGLPPELTRTVGSCSAIRNSSIRRSLASLCVGLAELCLCITQVLTVQYCSSSFRSGSGHKERLSLVPKQIAVDPCDTIRCDRELQQWYQDHAHEIQGLSPVAPQGIATSDCDVLDIHRAILKGLYLTAISVLHRPQALNPITSPILDPELRELSRRKVREAADDITTLYKELYSRGLVRYLPNTGVTCLLPATIVHLLQMKVGDNNPKQASNGKFKFCLKALQQLGQTYATASFAFEFLNAAATKLTKTKQADLEGRSQSWSSNRNHRHITSADEGQQIAPSGPSPSINTQFLAPDIVPQPTRTRLQPHHGDSFEWDSSHGAWGSVLTKAVPHNGNRTATSILDGPGIEQQTEAHMATDPNSFIYLEGCEDFFTMTDGVGIDIDMQWLEALGDI